jgi:hypothetical protein
MELPDELPDAMVPGARRFQLLGQRPADALPRVQPWSDAWGDVLPDEAEDGTAPERGDGRYAEKLVVPAPDVRARGVALYLPKALPQEAVAPCKPDADRSAA